MKQKLQLSQASSPCLSRVSPCRVITAALMRARCASQALQTLRHRVRAASMATLVKSIGTKSDGAVAIAWFRKDLRLHDNAMLEAASHYPALLPVYILDPQDFQARQGAEQLQGVAQLGIPRTGPWRCKYLVQCLARLRGELRARGSELLLRCGPPHEQLMQLMAQLAAAQRPPLLCLHFALGPLAEDAEQERRVVDACRNAAAAA
ncbi:hypothetical protein QJQ45_019510, partial [Haematococcus lacustris]